MKEVFPMQSIIHSISSLLTTENISLVLSILGIFGNVFLFTRTHFLEKVDIDIKIPGIFEPENGTLIAYFTFTNNSRLPVSITGISIVCDDNLYPCEQISDDIIKSTYAIGNWPETTTRNIPMPIHLPTLGAACGYVTFVAPSTYFQFPSKHLTVRLSTNRNQIVETTLEPESLLDQ